MVRYLEDFKRNSIIMLADIKYIFTSGEDDDKRDCKPKKYT